MTTQSSNILLVLANAANNFNGNMLDNKKQAIALLDALQISEMSDKEFALSIAHLDICADDAQFFAQPQFEGHICTKAYSFIRSLRFLANTTLVKHSKTSGGDRTNVQEFLQFAAEKHAANEKAAHDAEMAAIAQHPAIAPVVAACAKSRELITELNTCDKVRFFEIYSEITAAGKLPKLTPYFSMDFHTQEIFSTEKSTDALVTYNNFIKSGFVDAYILTHLFTAVRNAAQRLDLIVETSLYIAGQHQYNESEKTAGYKLLRLFGENTIGWVLDEPTATDSDTNGLFVQTANGEFAHVQDAADEADMSVEQYLAFRKPVAIANNCSEFASVENAAAKAGVDLGNYFDLYGDAGWELDFEPMQLEGLQDIYAAAKERDGDDDDKNSADELVERFAKFIHNKMQERHSFFLWKIENVGFKATAFCYEVLLHEQTKISLRVEENGNCHLKHLCAVVGNGSFCSISFCAHLSQDFEKFFCRKMEAFFRDILQNNL